MRHSSPAAVSSAAVHPRQESSQGRDRNERFLLFQQLDPMEEYVLVSRDERRVEVRRRAGHEWSSEVRGAGDTVRVHGHDVAVDFLYA